MDKNENENEKNIFTPMTEEKRKVLERPLGSSSKPLNYKELENVDKNFYESFQEALKAKNNSVLSFSNELNWSLEYFFAELKSAGVEKKSAYEQLTDQDKAAFLSHIIRYYRNGLEPLKKLKFNVTSKTTQMNSEINEETDSFNDPVVTKSEKIFLNVQPTKLQKLIAHYSIMSRDQVNELWNQGVNDFKGDERQAIYLVYRDKSKQNIQTEFSESMVSFVKKCPFCQSVFNKDNNLCQGCGTGFSRNPSLLFNDSKEDIKQDENGENNT